MIVSTLATSSIIYEIPFVDISVCMEEYSLAICFALTPIALILCSIFPGLDSFTLSYILGVLFYITLIDRTIGKIQSIYILKILYLLLLS